MNPRAGVPDRGGTKRASSVRRIPTEAPKAACVVSLGYERRSVVELLALLVAHGVEKLVDVREAPISRRPGFSKRALSQSLAEAGIEYLHLRAAGNPYRKEKAELAYCLALYSGYLSCHSEVLDLVGEQLGGVVVAFLCYEREHDCCHRSVLLQALTEQGHNLEIVRVQ
jgi:uncharacterized protein (DUF488 family)